MRIGFHRNFPDRAFEHALKLYREMGVDEIDMLMSEASAAVNTDVRTAMAQAETAGVPVKAVSPRWGWIDRALEDCSEIDRLLSLVEMAPELGTERIMLSCSFVKPESEDRRKAHFDKVVTLYRTLAQTAEPAGIDLCTHTTTRPGIMFGTAEGINAFLQGVDSKRNKLLFCCGCISLAGWDVSALIRRWSEALGAVHLFNPCGNWHQYEEMRFDTGQLNLFEVLKRLKQVNYEGVLIPHEYPTFSSLCGEDISHGWVVGYLRAMLQVLKV